VKSDTTKATVGAAEGTLFFGEDWIKRLRSHLDAPKLDRGEDMPHEVRQIEMAMKIGSDGGETMPDMSFASGHGLHRIEDCFWEKPGLIAGESRP
jgi:hypothetical protein